VANDNEISSSWRFMQIGLVVRDMDSAVASLTALGFGPFIPKYLPPGFKAMLGNGEPATSKNNVQRSMIGNVELELIQPVLGNSPHKEFLNTKGEGIQHVLFEVQDIDEELKRLTERGATILRRVNFKGGALAYVTLKPVVLSLN
jgi:methylmalonyl-CoA/ethylmalonyl-CoA epimerase